MQLFYAPGIGQEGGFLPAEEARHALRVLRLRSGDRIFVTDGLGKIYEATIGSDNADDCFLGNLKLYPGNQKRKFGVHIAVAPTKHADRMEWFIEKATEAGVDEITPLICARSERTRLNPDRLNKIIISAAKQALEPYFPRLNPPAAFADFIRHDFHAAKMIAWCGQPTDQNIRACCPPATNAVIMIGPEGDFTGPEVEQASLAGFTPVSLGSHRLRTETAAVFSCFAVHLINS